MMELIDSRAWDSCLPGGWKDACCSHRGMRVSFRRLHSLVTDAWTGMERLLTRPRSTLSPKNLQRNARQRGNAVHPPNQGGIQAVIGIKVRMSSEVQECKIYWLLSWSWGKGGQHSGGAGSDLPNHKACPPESGVCRELSASRSRALPASLSCARGPGSTSVQRAMLPKLDFLNVLNVSQCQEYCK